MSNLVFIQGTPVEVNVDATVGDLYSVYNGGPGIIYYTGKPLLDMKCTLADLGICPESCMSFKGRPLLLYMSFEKICYIDTDKEYICLNLEPAPPISQDFVFNPKTKREPTIIECILKKSKQGELSEEELPEEDCFIIVDDKIYDWEGKYFDIQTDDIASMAEGYIIRLYPNVYNYFIELDLRARGPYAVLSINNFACNHTFIRPGLQQSKRKQLYPDPKMETTKYNSGLKISTIRRLQS